MSRRVLRLRIRDEGASDPPRSLRREGAIVPFDTAQFADHVVVDPDGDEQRLGDLWAEQPQVILFLRHFG